MKINRSTRMKPLAIALIVTAIVLGVTGVSYTLGLLPFQTPSETVEVNLDTPTDEQIRDGEATKEKSINENSESVTKEPRDTTGSTPPTDSSDIRTAITVLEVNEQTLYVRNNIEGIYATGTCILTLTNGSETVTKTTGIQALPQSSTCKGFNIPTSELSNGDWNAKLDIQIVDKSGTSSRSITI